MATINVIAHKGCSANFTANAGPDRKEIEESIAEKLRTDKDIVWGDEPEGINVACISVYGFWRPRRRFFTTDDVDSQLLIEDKSETTPKWR
jgi:hypothetical protein